MKTSTSCSCHSEPDLCGAGVLERPRYYARQLLTPAEMILEQQYFRDKLRRHNRLIHGWGVVCGAAVCLVPEEPADGRRAAAAAPKPGGAQAPPAKARPWKVRVSPGYILGPYGDEILIDSEQIVDLRTCVQEGVTGGHGEPVDPWCVPVHVQREPGPLFLAVRYKELQSRPVRVQPAGCGCDDTQCEYSRWRDGYEICVLTECPPSHENPPDLDDFIGGPLPGCPECPADPWVVLARVEIDADGTITLIDNCSCRRLVVSFANSWWRCRGDSCAIESVEVKDGVRVEPRTSFTVVVRTRLLAVESPRIHLGDGIDSVGTVRVDGNRLEADFSVQADAEPGPRTLEIRDPAHNDRVVAAKANAVTVFSRQGSAVEPPAPPPPASPTPGGTPRQPNPPAQPEKSQEEAQPKPARGRGRGGKVSSGTLDEESKA